MLLILSLVLALTPSRPSEATSITLPYVYIDGQTLPASQLNGNFNTIVSDYNGSISNVNISNAANIAVTKLNLGTMVPALGLNSAGSATWGAGVTGDANPRITLYTDGFLKFGAGGASAVDVMIKRASSTQLSIRNAGDTLDRDLKVGVLTLGTFNTNGILYTTSGGVATATATGGTGRKVLTEITGGVPDLTSASGLFGGDGSDGAFVATSITDVLTQKNTTTTAVNNGITYTMRSGSRLNATSTITVGQGATGILAVFQGTNGGRGGSTTATPEFGQGACPGQTDFSLRTGGYGGSGGGGYGAGGSGGGPTALVVRGQQGLGGTWPWAGGSGGGGGYDGANAGGAGGNGGGKLTLCAVGDITINAGGTIRALGSNGSNAAGGNSGGGGGGSGGMLMICSQSSIVNSGTIDVTGGNGGNGAGTGGGGGGGGGGYVILWAPAVTAGTVTLTAGSAGTGGATGAAAGGGGTSQTITGTPNLPLLGKIEQNPEVLLKLAHVKGLRNREVAAMYARDSAEYLHLCSGSLTETCEGIGDAAELIPAA